MKYADLFHMQMLVVGTHQGSVSSCCLNFVYCY